MTSPCYHRGVPWISAPIKGSTLPRFNDYLWEVQQRNGLNPIPLIRAWTNQEIATIEGAFRAAVAASGIVGSLVQNFTGTNQSKGNQVANHFIAVLPGHLAAPNQITPARGSGYPDRLFSTANMGYCMELKATANWNNHNSQRRVLTSSPRKMLSLLNSGAIGNPPAHLICTLLYSEPNPNQGRVDGVRLDFLEPTSTVDVVLEASTSQSHLHLGAHHKLIIP